MLLSPLASLLTPKCGAELWDISPWTARKQLVVPQALELVETAAFSAKTRAEQGE